ncbi:MAG: tetratricopeptide repeat protein [candidate division WOR-3 bacterium]
MEKCDVLIISNESKEGRDFATYLEEIIKKQGYNLFVVYYESGRLGKEEKEKIDKAIETCKYLVIITVKGDKLPEECVKAIELKKRIIPCAYFPKEEYFYSYLYFFGHLEFSDKDELVKKVMTALNKIKEKENIPLEKNPDELLNRGLLLMKTEKFKDAIEEFEKALKIYKEIGDKSGEANCYGNLGICYERIGYDEKAIEYYEKALEIFKGIGDKSGEFKCYKNLIPIYFNLGSRFLYGKDLKAITYYNKALRLSQKAGDKNMEKECYSGLAKAYDNLGETEEAIEYYELALEISREIDEPEFTAGMYLLPLGVMYYTLKNYKKAIEYLEEAINIHDRGGMLAEHEVKQIYETLSDIYKELGDFEKAEEYEEKSKD